MHLKVPQEYSARNNLGSSSSEISWVGGCEGKGVNSVDHFDRRFKDVLIAGTDASSSTLVCAMITN
ncbi:hypothetical protein C5167_047281 [Papaver somniferum]|uniref:Uncharacterized protein n=1 Tax=Papaver somniferum TaxID=3469 RepID=A0A4Y7LK03_PAPSO|nr:hypothetical protein C5167_047281 [Papaver somniferum]